MTGKLKDLGAESTLRNYIHGILKESGGRISGDVFITKFIAATKSNFKSWFVKGRKGSVKKLLSVIIDGSMEIVSKNKGFDLQYKNPKDITVPTIIVPDQPQKLSRAEMFNCMPTKSRSKCVESLEVFVNNVKGASRESAIEIDDEENKVNIDVSEFVKDNYNELPVINFDEIANNFKPYYTYQEIHVAYVKLRLIAMFETNSISQFTDVALQKLFRVIFKEDFFNENVLKHFVSETTEKNGMLLLNNNKQYISKFVKRFCGDLFEYRSENIIHLKGNLKEHFVKCYANLDSILQKIKDDKDPNFSQNPASSSQQPFHVNERSILSGSQMYTPARQDKISAAQKSVPGMSVLGKFANGNEGLNVVASTQANRSRVPWFNFSNLEGGNQNHSPTINELNERVTFTRNRICREGRCVKVVEIVHDLCQFFNVSSLQHIRISGPNWMLRRETDVPAVFDIIKTQCKVNAFIQAFTTFRNICTLYELHEELCKFDNKTLFDDFKLGPFQQQLLIYDHFQFPPDKNNIPTISTKDVFQLLWKLQMKNRRENRNSEPIQITLESFMQYMILEYGFETPFESGIKIGSIGLAFSAVRKASYGNHQYVREISDEFQKSLCMDVKKLVSRGAEVLKNRLTLNPDIISYNCYVESIAGLQPIDAFLEIFVMLKNLKEEANEKLPGHYDFVKFSNILSDVFTIMRSDIALLNFFHLIISTASLKAIKINDIAVLKLLGFSKAIKEVISQEEKIAEKQISYKHANSSSSSSSAVAKDLLITTVKKWLEKNSEIDLDELLKLEQQILNQLNPEAFCFEELGHGSFLKIITEEEELRSLVRFETSSNAISSVSNGVPNNYLVEFIYQCQENVEEMYLARGICHQFQLAQDNEADAVLECIRKCKKENATIDKSSVVYEKALSINHSEYEQTSGKSELKILATDVLSSVPILTNIEKWTNWEMIYQQKLGNIRELIRTKVLSDNFHIVEVTPNHHIKVNKDRTMNDLVVALQAWDPVETCNCIISIIISHDNIDSTPLTLISSHIQNVFTKKEHMENDNTVLFTLKCFTLIPFHLLSSIVTKLFISNLSMAYGSSNVSELLLHNCQDTEERFTLHGLGMYLLNPLWIDDMKQWYGVQEEMNKPTETIENIEETEDQNESTDVCEDDNSISSELKAHTTEIDEVSEETSGISKNKLQSLMFDVNKICEEMEIEDGDQINTNPCFDLIECIRREQFGIGVVFDEEQQKLIEVHREREGRSLQRLSKELYSTDSHFALELIQNADDNHYDYTSLHEGEQPTVAFILHADKIVVLNNEKGFMKEHIRALCDVGKSTKGIHRKGYIGQKGIGFKSVFRITDCPEIHSNGYHMKFDASKGPNGYILPTWIEQRDEFNIQSKTPTLDIEYSWMTNIILPLKQEMEMSRLIARFYDVHPSLLMFLNQLQKIIIADQVSGKVNVMQKKFIENNILEVSLNDVSQLWFIVSKEVSLKVKDQVKETNVALAFPIQQKELHPQPIFAYLPLRSYGFKFIIQADFEIPSSREDIYKDNSWNQCILQNIPNLVIEAFHEIKNHPFFSGIDGILEFFKFMDIEDHVLGIFQPVAKQIIKSLQKEKCLPAVDPSTPYTDATVNVEDAENANKQYKWVLPSTIVFSQKKLQHIIPPNVLFAYLESHYLVDQIQLNIPKGTLESLGVKYISLEQLLDVAVNYLARNSPTLDNYKWLSRWFLSVYEILQDACDFSEASLNKIRKSKIFPLTYGKLICLEDNTVFLSDRLRTSHPSHQSNMEIIEQDLKILNSQMVLNIEDKVEQKQIIQFLHMLGVKPLTPDHIMKHYIYPILKSESWKSKDDDLLVACVKYLFHYYNQQNNEKLSVDQLKSCLVLKTNKGVTKVSDNLIYVPSFYGNPIDLEKQLPSGDWLLVSDEYAKGSSKSEINQWFQFFSDLGFKTFFTVQNKKKVLNKKQLELSVWKEELSSWPTTDNECYVIHDMIIPEYSMIIQKGRTKEVETLSSLISSHWEIEFARYNFSSRNCSVFDTKGNELCKTYSSLLFEMRSSCWILASSPSSFQSSLSYPKHLYIKSNDFISVLANKVSYMDKTYQHLDFFNVLGIKSSLTKEVFIVELKKWMKESSFSTTFDHILNIYKYMSTFSLDLFQSVGIDILNGPIVFLPTYGFNRIPSTGREVVTGKFWSCKAVCMRDPSGVLLKMKSYGKHLKVLSYFYPKSESISTFFTNTLNIPTQPSFDEYLKILDEIVSAISLPDTEECLKIYDVLSVLGESFLTTQSESFFNELIYPKHVTEQLKFYGSLGNFIGHAAYSAVKKSNVIQRKFLPTYKNHFTSIGELPLICFNEDLSKPFMNEKLDLIFVRDIHKLLKTRRFGTSRFVESAERKLTLLLLFFKACNMTALTEVYLEPEIITEKIEKGCSDWEKTLSDMFPIIQRYLMSRLPNIYQQLCEQLHGDIKFKDYLFNTVIFLAEKLEVVYRLKDRSGVNVVKPKTCAVERYGSKALIYICKNKVESHFDEVLNEILIIFVKDDDHKKEQLLEFLLDYLAVHNKNQFLNRKRISQLTCHDEIWEYPRPVEEIKITQKKVLVEKLESKDQSKQSDAKPKIPKGSISSWPPRKPSNYTENKKNTDKPKTPSATKHWERPASPDSINRKRFKERKEASLPTKRKLSPDKNEDETKAKKTRKDNDIEFVKSTKQSDKESGQAKEIDTSDDNINEEEDPMEIVGDANPDITQDSSISNHNESTLTSLLEPAPFNPFLLPIFSVKTSLPKPALFNPFQLPIYDIETSLPKPALFNRLKLPIYNIETSLPKPALFNPFQLPIYNVESEYEDIPLSNAPSFTFPINHRSETNDENTSSLITGSIGEEIVFNHLNKVYEEDIKNRNIQIEWLNSENETGAPFDMKLTFESGKTIYVEVKTTVHDTKKEFEISFQQIKFALEQGEFFHLYRVSGVTDPESVRIKRLMNLAMYLDKKAVKLFMVL